MSEQTEGEVCPSSGSGSGSVFSHVVVIGGRECI